MLLSHAPGRAFRRREKQNASLTRPGPCVSPPREAKCFSHVPRTGQFAFSITKHFVPDGEMKMNKWAEWAEWSAVNVPIRVEV